MTKKILWQKGTAVELLMLGMVLIISVFLLFLAVTSKPNEQANLPNNEASISSSLVANAHMPAVLYNLTGSIEQINSEMIVFQANVAKDDGSGRLLPSKEIRQALITPETQFSKLEIIFDQENKQQVISETKMSLANFKVGDQIEVIANRDIKEAYQFEARQVRLRPKL